MVQFETDVRQETNSYDYTLKYDICKDHPWNRKSLNIYHTDIQKENTKEIVGNIVPRSLTSSQEGNKTAIYNPPIAKDASNQIFRSPNNNH